MEFTLTGLTIKTEDYIEDIAIMLNYEGLSGSLLAKREEVFQNIRNIITNGGKKEPSEDMFREK